MGLLYGVNTIGAALGTLGAAFLLLPRVGLAGTVWVAVAINAAVFVLALLLERGSTDAPASAVGPKPIHGAETFEGSWILPLMLISGMVSFCWEVLWTRLLSHLLGGSIYAFAVMLATFLIGIAAGSLVAGRWAQSAGQARRGFAISQTAIAGTSLAAFAWVDELPGLSAGLTGPWHGVPASGLTLLPAALFIGATFPLAVRILTGDAQLAGSAGARVYAWNTLGAIFGSVGAGFLLLPALGLVGTARLCVALSCLLALWTTLRSPRLGKLAVVASLLLGVVAFLPPGVPWSVLRTSPLNGGTIQGTIAFFSVGRSSTVMVSEQSGLWRLSTNGLPESAIQPRGARKSAFPVARWLALLPTMSRPDLKSMLIVGLGTGLTVEAVPDSVDEIHVVELEPEVVEGQSTLGPCARARSPGRPAATPPSQ